MKFLVADSTAGMNIMPEDRTASRWPMESMEDKRAQQSMLRCWETSLSLPPNGRHRSRVYRTLASSKVPRAPSSWLYRTTPVLGALCRGRWAWNWLLSQQMGQKFVSSSCTSGWNPGCDTLNLILLAVFNSQNIILDNMAAWSACKHRKGLLRDLLSTCFCKSGIQKQKNTTASNFSSEARPASLSVANSLCPSNSLGKRGV